MAMALFTAGQRICVERGLILVDTKYEFGRTKDGKLVVIDEISHSGLGSRFWQVHTYDERFAAGLDPDPLDKDFVRRWYLGQGYKGDGTPPPMTDDVRASVPPSGYDRGLRAKRPAVRSCPTPPRRWSA